MSNADRAVPWILCASMKLKNIEKSESRQYDLYTVHRVILMQYDRSVDFDSWINGVNFDFNHFGKFNAAGPQIGCESVSLLLISKFFIQLRKHSNTFP